VTVEISRSARKFLEDRGLRTVVLRYMELEAGCMVGVAKDVDVGFDRPVDQEDFRRNEVEGIEVFIDRRLKEDATVVIKKQGLWKFANLYADGLRVPL
jgi:hypothetical protein